MKNSKLAVGIHLRSYLDKKCTHPAANIQFLHPCFCLGQQLQEHPQIQRTEVNTNHVLIYFEEVRTLRDSSGCVRTMRGTSKPIQVPNRAFHIHTPGRRTATMGKEDWAGRNARFTTFNHS